MSEHTEHQIIRGPDDAPLFVVVPWDEYEKHFTGRPDDAVLIPHEVVELNLMQDMSLIRAWREHLGLSQRQVAERMGITQPAYSRMESPSANPRVATLKKIAQAMGIQWEQLRD